MCTFLMVRVGRRIYVALLSIFLFYLFVLQLVSLYHPVPAVAVVSPDPSLHNPVPVVSAVSPDVVVSRNRSTPRSIVVLKSFQSPYSLPITPMISQTNFWGMPETIGYSDGGGFNPTFLSLPADGNNNGSF